MTNTDQLAGVRLRSQVTSGKIMPGGAAIRAGRVCVAERKRAVDDK